MTAIKIKANKGITDHFTEDDTTGIYRIGRQIIIDKPVEKVAFFNTPEVSINTDFTQRADILTFQLLTSSFSGVKKSIWESEDIGKINNSGSYYSMSKNRQGVEVRSTFDLDADALPYVYIQGGSSPYPKHIFENFLPTFDEDFFGVKEQLNRRNYVPFEDIIEANPQYLSASVYLEIADPYEKKIYPRYSGSHFTNKLSSNGAIEPFDIERRLSKDITLIDSVSAFAARRFFTGISATIMGSEREFKGSGTSPNFKKGSTPIVQKIEVNNPKTSYIADISHEIDEIEAFDDVKQIFRLSNDLHTISALEHKGKFSIKSFDDTLNYIDTSTNYSFMTKTQIRELTSGSMRNISEIGSRYVSATAGFVYESTTLCNTTLGTDSIAFGGLKR